MGLKNYWRFKMGKKDKWTKKDVQEFDRLLTESELKGMGNYKRNIGRLRLNKWLEQWTVKAKDDMWQIVVNM